MTKTSRGPGNTVDFTAAGTITAGNVYIVGGFLGVAVNSAVAGELYTLALTGWHELPKKTTDVLTDGLAVYWDPTPGEVTLTSAAGNYLLGKCKAAGNGVTTVEVLLLPGLAAAVV